MVSSARLPSRRRPHVYAELDRTVATRISGRGDCSAIQVYTCKSLDVNRSVEAALRKEGGKMKRIRYIEGLPAQALRLGTVATHE